MFSMAQACITSCSYYILPCVLCDVVHSGRCSAFFAFIFMIYSLASLFSIILVALLILWQCSEHVLFLSLFIVANILLFFVCSVA